MHAILSGGSAHDSVHRRADAQDRERQAAARVEEPVLAPTLPDEVTIAHQFVDGQSAVVGQAEQRQRRVEMRFLRVKGVETDQHDNDVRSEEPTSELQSLIRNSYAVFGLKKNKT